METCESFLPLLRQTATLGDFSVLLSVIFCTGHI